MEGFDGRTGVIAEILGELRMACDTGYAVAVHIRYTRPTLLYQTYPQAWADHYSERGYMLSDPVVHWGLGQTGWVEWASLTGNDTAGVIADAVAHGLTNGLTYATGAASSRTIAGLTRSSAAFTAPQRARMAALVDRLHDLTEGFDDFPERLQSDLRHLT